jgi:prepilin-type N-terminal cleavage/methylation domain-containing protein
MQKRRSSFGFTMIELLVAATILAVVSGIGLVSFTSANIRARDGKRKGDLENVRSSLEQYRTDIGSYPVGNVWDDMITTVYNAEYLNAQTMYDPKNATPYVYTYTSADGRTYQVCATLEATEAAYCLTNP